MNCQPLMASFSPDNHVDRTSKNCGTSRITWPLEVGLSMNFIFPYIGNAIIPTDLTNFFQRGRYTTHQIVFWWNFEWRRPLFPRWSLGWSPCFCGSRDSFRTEKYGILDPTFWTSGRLQHTTPKKSPKGGPQAFLAIVSGGQNLGLWSAPGFSAALPEFFAKKSIRTCSRSAVTFETHPATFEGQIRSS